MVRRKGERPRVGQKGYGTVLLAMIVHALCPSSREIGAAPVEQDYEQQSDQHDKLPCLLEVTIGHCHSCLIV